MLSFNNISKVFPDGTKAVDNVSLHINKGEFCVFLGSSGAGKSTLMGMVNGIVEPTMGEVDIDGERLSKKNVKTIQKKVGMVHQQLHLVPRLSVIHNVLTGLLPCTSTISSIFKYFSPQMQRAACNMLEEVELEEKHLYRRASELSGGQQQRVAIARAFIIKPNVVLADEPVASLDPEISRGVLGLLKKSAKNHGAAVLCSLHQVDYALEFADRIIGLKEGKITYDGSPEGLSDRILKKLYDNHNQPEIDTNFVHPENETEVIGFANTQVA